MQKKKTVRLVLGILCLALAVWQAVKLNTPTTNEKVELVSSVYGDQIVALEASYWPVEGAEYAALICPGYSCDRQKWRPIADQLVGNGITVMSIDYAGQGASTGRIGFNNADTDNISVEIDDAVRHLMRLTGLPEDHIILVGHSMGGRAILRLLYDYNNENAVTTVKHRDIGAAILISPGVNYLGNAQASLFAGSDDSAREPWVSLSGDDLGTTQVWLIGSTADDIVSDEDMLAIYRRLSGADAPESGTYEGDAETASGTGVHIRITSGSLHSYEMFSPRIGARVNRALTAITGRDADYAASHLSLVYVAWILGLLGIGLTLSGLNARAGEDDTLPVLTDARAFLKRKAFLWLPGLLVSVVLCALCVAVPTGSPVMNIPYLAFIAGYGLTMLWAWRRGSFAGIDGALPRPAWKKTGLASLAVTVAVTAALCFAVWYVLRATMYRLIPLNTRVLWVLLASVLMAVSFYISGCETEMLRKAGAKVRVRLLYHLIQYVPLFLLILFYGVLRSYSGMIGQVQNMVLMYIFCIPLGRWLRARTGSRAVGAVMTAFLFQTLMITSAALIGLW